jgi:TonB family protein
MKRHFIAFSLAAFVFTGGFVRGQEKSNPSRDSQPLLKRCSKENPPPCIDKVPIPVLNPEPSCSKEAEKAKIKGRTAFQAVVGTDGMLHDISVVKPLGHGLDEEVVKAATNWRFKPGKSSGKPTPSLIYVELDISCP